jgi:hypothetical protein
MNTQERYLKITELLKEFKNGEELYKKSPIFHQSIQMMAEGLSPFETLEQVIIACERTQKSFEDYMLRDTRPTLRDQVIHAGTIPLSKEWQNEIDRQSLPYQDLPKTTNKPNLKELEKRIDNVLANETPESLNLFLFHQRCDLTDEELLKFPKEEILQLYKNCYEMHLKYTKADQDSRENLRKALSDAFEAGRDFQMGEYSEYHGGHESETPDKKEWIDEYLKHKE